MIWFRGPDAVASRSYFRFRPTASKTTAGRAMQLRQQNHPCHERGWALFWRSAALNPKYTGERIDPMPRGMQTYPRQLLFSPFRYPVDIAVRVRGSIGFLIARKPGVLAGVPGFVTDPAALRSEKKVRRLSSHLGYNRACSGRLCIPEVRSKAIPERGKPGVTGDRFRKGTTDSQCLGHVPFPLKDRCLPMSLPLPFPPTFQQEVLQFK